MSVDKNYNISQFIAEQFPDIYNEDGPLLVAFVKSYYEWMETQGPVFHSRRLLEYTDIDQTIEQFIVHFKETYLKDVQLDTATNTPQLIKHSLDLYRSKGTQRAIELFFKLVFAEDAEVYYPSTDVFTLSSGEWIVPTYLEITPAKLNAALVGQQIIGLRSGATAFVEKLIRKNIGSRYSEILMISAINGTFSNDELIRPSTVESVHTIDNDDDVFDLDLLGVSGYPFVRGSLSSITIIDGGTNFSIGDVVDVISAVGIQGQARISAIESQTGLANFSLVNGGWGYSPANATIIVTQEVLRLSNVTFSTSDNTATFSTQVRMVSQPKANVAFANASSLFNPGDNFFTYYANNSVKGTGQVLSVQTSNSSVGSLLVSVISGNIQSNAFYTTANAVSANQTAYTDQTATGRVFGRSSNVSMYYSNAVGSVSKGDVVYQFDDHGQKFVYATVLDDTANTSIDGNIKVNNVHSMFLSNRNIFSNSGFSANVSQFSVDLGIANVTGTWIDTPHNIVYDSLSTSVASVQSVTRGSGATFKYSPTLAYSEYNQINTDFILPFANVALNAATFGGTLGSANLSTVIDSALNYANTLLGQITSLNSLNPGENYNYPPFAIIGEKLIVSYQLEDYILHINNATGVFAVGELIRQSTGAQSIVTTANSSTVHCTRMNFHDKWTPTTNSSTQVIGVGSGFTANLSGFDYDTTSAFIGQNANVSTSVITSNTSAKELQIINSGFNYVSGELVEFTDGINSGTAEVAAETQGIALGYSRTTDSTLSSDKFLADGFYYQDFAYEIRSGVPLSKYEAMLKKLLHVAGTKYFTAFNKTALLNAPASGSSTVIVS